MTSVTLYTTPFCGYCLMAKRLFADRGVAVEEVDLAREPARRAEMVERSAGRRSVPQVFIGGAHVGGFDELYELERAGRLGPMLAEG